MSAAKINASVASVKTFTVEVKLSTGKVNMSAGEMKASAMVEDATSAKPANAKTQFSSQANCSNNSGTTSK